MDEATLIEKLLKIEAVIEMRIKFELIIIS